MNTRAFLRLLLPFPTFSVGFSGRPMCEPAKRLFFPTRSNVMTEASSFSSLSLPLSPSLFTYLCCGIA